jgi:precorrin-3B synthase
MGDFAIKGWCPSGHRPMQSGDGLVLRIRPPTGRLSRAQALAIADLAERHGNGLIDLTHRANLQIRGLHAEDHEPLVASLARLKLIDRDAATETERNILVAPFWSENDESRTLAIQLERALGDRPLGLPEKFGFAVDCGEAPMLTQASADVRIERSADGSLIVRADGATHGLRVARAHAVAAALALARWFLAAGGAKDGRGRMAALVGRGHLPSQTLAGWAEPARPLRPPHPGVRASGALVGLAFGQMHVRHPMLGRNARIGFLRSVPLRSIYAMRRCRRLRSGEAGLPPLQQSARTPASPRCRHAYGASRADCQESAGAAESLGDA